MTFGVFCEDHDSHYECPWNVKSKHNDHVKLDGKVHLEEILVVLHKDYNQWLAY